MRFSKSFIWFLLIILLAGFSIKAADSNEVENEVVRLLKTRDVGELANELAAKNSVTIRDLLIKISVYARAGHHLRVLETLKLLIPKTPEFQTDLQKWRLRETLAKAIGGDFEARKIYYENFDQFGIDSAGSFVEQWKKQGDVKELEKWLFERKDKYIWREQWINLKKYLGTADEIYREAEQEIRRNPTDYDKIRYYLNLVPPTQNNLWLLDVVPQETAYQTYFLANSIVYQNSELQIKLLEKSLTLPFPDTEKERFIMECAMRTQSGIVPKKSRKTTPLLDKEGFTGNSKR